MPPWTDRSKLGVHSRSQAGSCAYNQEISCDDPSQIGGYLKPNEKRHIVCTGRLPILGYFAHILEIAK